MISVSEAYKKLVKENIRPKCEPIIVVSGIDENGNETEIIWRASNIQNLKFIREIDPLGRKLPYMELTWTELCYEKFTEDNYPEKYKNIAKYMAVDLYFVQDLSFRNNWSVIYESGTTWKSIFENKKTWKDIKNGVSQETIKFPRMFLSARPETSNNKIKWKANDIIYFFTEAQVKSFSQNIDFVNPIRYFLMSERANFKNSPQMLETIQEQNEYLKVFQENSSYEMRNKILFDGETKGLFLNYFSLRNLYMDFRGNVFCLFYPNQYENNERQEFSGIVMYSYPKMTRETNVSNYSFKSYNLVKEEDKSYNLSYSRKIDIGANSVYMFNFDGYGEATSEAESGYSITRSEIDHAISFFENISVTPIKLKSEQNTMYTGLLGETFLEDNKLNPYSGADYWAYERFENITKYFNENGSVLEFSCLPNLSVETSDIISVQTNAFYSSGERIFKNCVVVRQELDYNGAVKQKIIAHEVFQ